MRTLACAGGADLMLKWAKIAISAITMAGVAWFVFLRSDFNFSLDTFAKISPIFIVIAFAMTIVAALIASLRLFITARIFGYWISFPQSVAALSLGQIGGALFFQLAGQLMARSAWLSRFQVPVSGTLVITGYERVSALVASLLMASSGVLYLFGGLTFQASSASTNPIRLAVGLILAASFGAWFVWGHFAWTKIRQIKPKHIVQFVINVVASLVAQSATMAVYVMLAKALNPELDIFALFAASTLVMFAASIPISFAGWGVREFSAVAALGFIGLSPDAAFIVAVMVGVMSLLAVALLSLTALWPASALLPMSTERQHRIDYSTFINMFIAIAAPTAIFFQIFVPANGREVNVNLADPVVLLGGALFVAHYFSGQYPQWRFHRLLLHLAACTAVLALSYVVGLLSFGWSDWAFTNKFLGWFVLLAYAATGALIAGQVRDGRGLLVAVMVATACSIVVLDLSARALFLANVPHALEFMTLPLSGFSQNRNSFGFALLICICCLLAGYKSQRVVPLGVLVGAVWFAGSRAIFGALPLVFVTAGFCRAITLKDAAKILAVAVLVISAVALVPFFISLATIATAALSGSGGALPHVMLGRMVPDISAAESNIERIQSIIGGLHLFMSNPLFGAGLGAYFEQTRAAGHAVVIHSVPVWLLAEMGILGFMVFFISAVRLFFTQWRRSTSDRCALLIVLILVAFGVVSLAHEILYQRIFWLVLGAALVVESAPILTRRRDEDESADDGENGMAGQLQGAVPR